MTVAEGTSESGTTPAETVTVTIDGHEMSVPAGTLVIRAAELIGIQIPRFCDHPLLDPVGACRQCLVELEGGRKPVASCTTPVADGMVVHTQLTSETAEKAQRGVMELLLINHPLDCPVCDKGGECPLQNQAMSTGRPESRFDGAKRTFPKPIPLSTEILLDRERCVLCARCTRFSGQIAGDPFIDLLERGANQQVGIYGGGTGTADGEPDAAEGQPLDSYFSGNTVQICPVGALTSATYRFRARPFDLISSPSACEHCASGCAQRTDHRRGKVLRRLAGDDPEVNEEWNCDKGRFAFAYARERDRLDSPLVRGESGELEPASWSEALAIAARGLSAARGSTGVLVGGRCTWEDAYGYAKFARIALGTNDVDFRARAHSAEEEQFLASRVAGRRGEVTYADLDRAPVVLCAGFEPEEESPIVFLRLRKAVRRGTTRVHTIAPFVSAGTAKLSGSLIRTVPGDEATALEALRGHDLLRRPGSVLLVGERLASVPGALSAATRLAADTGAHLAWIPRRAGERGALEAGALPSLLPGGRPVDDPAARREVADGWRVADLPSTPGRDTHTTLEAARRGELAALLVGGVEAADLPDPDPVRAAAESAGFVVSLELRRSAVTDLADVVFPVAPVAEKAGTFLDWEGRARTFDVALDTGAMPDLRVLAALADEMGVALGVRDATAARAELARLGAWDGPVAAPPVADAGPAQTAGPGEAVLATWRMLLDDGRLQDGEPHLAGTARPPVVRIAPALAAELDVRDGDPVTVSTDRGAITLPAAVTDLPDRVVWVPLNSPGSAPYRRLGVGAGDLVRVAAGARRSGEAE
ncbi:NADH-quinone oxidoreductase subunit G [Rhodococcus triatomae]|uniref:NADH-quinone oxidoreductase n=1 Tax=Rhodococcus triatomae TaxID=300028 RepID=A0A1G8QVN6_9NOCA|nr:NADH-quinone oxidoreductase subunit G [Rhodococcus triatomae]QNG20773.1 NADH-quinone oxidoreductase subunit G [Rhodococcus triatomae]QNG23311.1 NADH-quinone oxidoreductase subunit G [Rhodococcus triatomae]SDJ08731.1 NADH-quinone oxidoreductase subunit G [Rhodococcus triatomae]